MASPSTLQRILRSQSQSAIKFFSNFNKPPPFFLTQIPQIPKPIDSAHPQTDYPKPNPSICSHAYPTFSFSYFLNPMSPPSLIRSVPDEDTTLDDSRTIRADSVKKKRKKKMNKHKLRKLRKRLRRKT